MDFANGNYQLNDQDSGDLVVQMAIKQFGCQGAARTSDNSNLRFEFFQNQILAIDEEGNFYTGVPEPMEILWNGKYRMTPIDCIFVYRGMYNKVNIDGHVDGMHHLSQDGCNAILKDNDGRELSFQVTERSISGTMASDLPHEFMAGYLDEGSFVIHR